MSNVKLESFLISLQNEILIKYISIKNQNIKPESHLLSNDKLRALNENVDKKSNHASFYDYLTEFLINYNDLMTQLDVEDSKQILQLKEELQTLITSFKALVELSSSKTRSFSIELSKSAFEITGFKNLAGLSTTGTNVNKFLTDNKIDVADVTSYIEKIKHIQMPLKKECTNQKQTIYDLRGELLKITQDLLRTQEKVNSQNDIINKLNDDLLKAYTTSKNHEDQAKKDADTIKELQKKLEAAENQLIEKDKTIKDTLLEKSNYIEIIEKDSTQLKELQKTIQNLNTENYIYHEENNALKIELEQKDKTIETLTHELKEKEDEHTINEILQKKLEEVQISHQKEQEAFKKQIEEASKTIQNLSEQNSTLQLCAQLLNGYTIPSESPVINVSPTHTTDKSQIKPSSTSIFNTTSLKDKKDTKKKLGDGENHLPPVHSLPSIPTQTNPSKSYS